MCHNALENKWFNILYSILNKLCVHDLVCDDILPDVPINMTNVIKLRYYLSVILNFLWKKYPGYAHKT